MKKRSQRKQRKLDRANNTENTRRMKVREFFLKRAAKGLPISQKALRNAFPRGIPEEVQNALTR